MLIIIPQAGTFIFINLKMRHREVRKIVRKQAVSGRTGI